MEASKIKSSVVKICNSSTAKNKKCCNMTGSSVRNNCASSVSFKGSANTSKLFWLYFRKLSNYMKEENEMTNAIIQMLGTGLIAPFAIMCSPSPKKKGKHKEDPNNDKSKKFFQAIRQPVSAFLAFFFQVPTTVGISRLLNHMAYKKHCSVFNDEVLGHLIPDKKYLKKEAEKVLKGKAGTEMAKEWAEELKLGENSKKIKSELIDKIREEYKEVNIDISESKLKELASSEKRLRKFLAEKMADKKHEKLVREKIQELAGKSFSHIKDIDLVTEGYQLEAKTKFKAKFDALKKEANLSWFDKFVKSMGLSNKKLAALAEREQELAKRKGLALMKKDMPAVFKGDAKARLKTIIENRIVKSQKLFGNKIFWFTLASNLVMVAISCVALNKFHPMFADFIDKIRGKKSSSPERQKAGVKA